MNHLDETACRRTLEELASCWPDAALPAALAERVEACPACRQERASFEALCSKSVSWSRTLPASHWRALAGSTRRAIRPRRAAPRAVVWAPALAFAAACLAVLFTYRVPEVAVPRWRPAPALPPREVLENQELLERLDLFKEWDGVKAVAEGAS